MSDNLYEVLGVDPTASQKAIQSAFRKRSKEAHPDQGGNSEEFDKLKQAYEVLKDPSRRARYDRTGRADEVKVTPQAIQALIDNTVRAMVMAERDDGTTDNPDWEDIRQKVLQTILNGRREAMTNHRRAQKKVARLDKIASKFKSKTKEDPLGDAFAALRKELVDEVNRYEDGIELNRKTEEVFRSYDYDVGPRPEGQFSLGPTFRLSGSSSSSDWTR
jgi:curved DNA-binding protein CbpA